SHTYHLYTLHREHSPITSDRKTSSLYRRSLFKDRTDKKIPSFNMIRWWLDKGIDGFRLDAISHVKKDEYSVKATENPFSPFQN
ncbi:alpha-amylase family glycosyl hydrolase, partial [Enterococcus faecium]|uniref:alpha-amylase family glycosyl hydrolase n=1 Tax=Enterococcus faecium TaxID=1352 RepID=UPI0037C0B581